MELASGVAAPAGGDAALAAATAAAAPEAAAAAGETGQAAEDGDSDDDGGDDGEDDAPANVAGLSKNAAKKAARRAQREARNKEKKAQKKEKEKAAKAERWEQIKQRNAQMTNEERAEYEARKKSAEARKAAKATQRDAVAAALEAGQNIVIDCAFEDLMTEGELRSMAGQLANCYAANKRAASRLSWTGLGAGISAGLAKMAGSAQWPVARSSASYMELFDARRADLVYLTADSPHELAELSASDVYIIGGIVDRNRHKGLTLAKAATDGIRTARLPLGAHLALMGSPVLTVNQVMAILLAYLELRDWGAACARAVPQRKRARGADAGDAGEQPQAGADGGAEGAADGAAPDGGHADAGGQAAAKRARAAEAGDGDGGGGGGGE